MRIWPLILATGCRGFFNVPPVADAKATGDGAPASVACVQTNGIHEMGTASIVLGYTNDEHPGNTNVIVLGWNGGGLVSMDDSVNHTFTSAIGPTQASSGWTQQIWYSTNIAGGSDTFNATFSASVEVDVALFEYSGLRDAAQAVSAIGTASDRPQTSAITTTDAHDLMFAALSSITDINTTVVTGYMTRVSSPTLLTADDEVQTVGNYSAVTTAMTQGSWVMQLVALRAE